MIDPLTLSIGIGLAVGLILVELLGLYAGGMVVPGYIALEMHQPGSVVLTLVDGLLIFFIMKIISRYLIIYGRRRIALIVLIAFLLGALLRHVFFSYAVVTNLGQVYTVIGYIIPGLIALAIDRQGIIETFTTLLTASVIVRLILILLIGPVLLSS